MSAPVLGIVPVPLGVSGTGAEEADGAEENGHDQGLSRLAHVFSEC
jgi:hypothetical protein